jgi:hypothetical protein
MRVVPAAAALCKKNSLKKQRCAGDATSSNNTKDVLSGHVLRHVLDLVSPGEWRFVAEVSSLFIAAYEKVPAT